ncbi:MAG: response regulator, partial [Pseudomonadota bacterium]
RMPVMDGLQMAQAIREINPEIRIIATTAHSDTSYLLEAIEIGIDHYVLKPVDIRKLLTAIEKCSRDIAAKKALESHRREREKLIVELQTALDEIKTLRGILPICSYCKDIRNDEGYWERVDTYITRHTEVDFSHGICPSCLKKNFPDQYESIMERVNQESRKK